MKEIEIIIVDDNSNDDSLKIIQRYMKNDKRIKLIKNKENRRILFSKSIAALNSKGKYIIELDQDDMFIRDDAFDILYEESEKYELDLLNFNSNYGNNSFEFNKKENLLQNKNMAKKYPKPISNKFKEKICLLWGNLILADLYKKVIYNLWPIIINYKIIFQEDFLVTFFIKIYAQKYQKIKNKFYFHLKNVQSASNDNKNNSEYYLSVVFAGIIFFDYYIDYYSQDIHILINYINHLKEDFKQIKKLFPELLKYLFGKIFSKKELSTLHKKELLETFNISENNDSCVFLNINHSFNKNKLPMKNSYNYRKKDQLIELSIIIVCSKYEKIIKLIPVSQITNIKIQKILIS